VINHIEQSGILATGDPRAALGYVYFDYKDRARQTPENFLAELIKQLEFQLAYCPTSTEMPQCLTFSNCTRVCIHDIGGRARAGVRVSGSGVVSLFVDLFCSVQSFAFPFSGSKGTMGSRWELRHLAGSPGGGGGVFRLCHTLIRVNTV